MSIRIPQKADREVQDGLRDADQELADLRDDMSVLRAELDAVRALIPAAGPAPSHTNLGDVTIHGNLHVAGDSTLSGDLVAPGQVDGFVGTVKPVVGVGSGSGPAPVFGGTSLASRIIQVHGSLAVGSAIQCETIDSRSIFNHGVLVDHPMGEMSYFNTTGTTITISAQSDGLSNMVLVNVASAITVFDVDNSTAHNHFDNGGSNNGTLRYVGDNTYHFHIACTWSAEPATGNDVFVFGVAKNGTVIQPSRVINTLAGGATQGNAIHVAITLANTDYIQLFVGNLTAGRNCIIKSVNLFAMGAHHCHCSG